MSDISLETSEAVQAFEAVNRELLEFTQVNPGVYEYLRGLLDRRESALNRVEQLARTQGISIGPVKRVREVQRVDGEALALWAADKTPEQLAEVGVEIVQTYKGSGIAKLREALRNNKITQEVYDSLVDSSAVYESPKGGSLPHMEVTT